MVATFPAYNEVYNLVLRVFDLAKGFNREIRLAEEETIIRYGTELLRTLIRMRRNQSSDLPLDYLWEDFDFLKMELLQCAEMGVYSDETLLELKLHMTDIEKQWAPLGYTEILIR